MTTTGKRISVIVPVLNPRESLATLHQTILDTIRGLSDVEWHKIVFVDNTSSDGWRDVICELTPQREETLAVRFCRTLANSTALERGIPHASGDIITMDAHWQEDATEIPRLLSKLEFKKRRFRGRTPKPSATVETILLARKDE